MIALVSTVRKLALLGVQAALTCSAQLVTNTLTSIAPPKAIAGLVTKH